MVRFLFFRQVAKDAGSVGNMYFLTTLQESVALYDNPVSRLQTGENLNPAVLTQSGSHQPQVDLVLIYHKYFFELSKGHNGGFRDHQGRV